MHRVIPVQGVLPARRHSAFARGAKRRIEVPCLCQIELRPAKMHLRKVLLETGRVRGQLGRRWSARQVHAHRPCLRLAPVLRGSLRSPGPKRRSARSYLRCFRNPRRTHVPSRPDALERVASDLEETVEPDDPLSRVGRRAQLDLGVVDVPGSRSDNGVEDGRMRKAAVPSSTLR